MTDILAQIVSHKRTEVAEAQARCPLDQVQYHARAADPPRDFCAAVRRSSDRINVIAEVKKASPSAGLIRADFDPVAIARAYHENGAAAISCLTDERFFQGSLEYLSWIRAAVSLPILRKDFIIDPYQVHEARAAGADAILLIAECLDDQTLAQLTALAGELRLTVLLEIHDRANLGRALRAIEHNPATSCLLGINNRDLKTMTTRLDHTIDLLADIPDPGLVVSESGIRRHDDVQHLLSAGVRAVLVGEHLMRQPDPGHALADLIG